MRILLCCLFLGVAGWVGAQPNIQWQKCLGGDETDYVSCVQQTQDHGYIIAGHTLSDNGDVDGNKGIFDFWVVKLDNSGAIHWKKGLGGGHDDYVFAIRQTLDKGYVVAGLTFSTDGDITNNQGEKDAWVIKLDSIGNLEWQKTLGGSGVDEARSMELTSDGGIILAGSSNSLDGDVSDNLGGLDFWVVKLTDEGLLEWQKSLGGSSDDVALSIKQCVDGGYIVVGETFSNDLDVSGNHGNLDYWVAKIDATGGIEWQNTLGGIGLDVASDVVETSDGFVVCGYSGSYNTGNVSGHHGSLDYWIVKLSKEGDLIWQKCFGGTNYDYGRKIIQNSDGDLIVIGEVKSKNGDVVGNIGVQMIWVLKLDQAGELIWKKILGGTEGEGSGDIQHTSDSGYILGGYTWSNNGDVTGNHGRSDYWVVKLAPPSSPTTQPTTQPLNLYPNPTTQSITIQIPDTESTLNIQITDLLGRELGRQTIPNGGAVDIESLPNGVYLVAASTESGEVFLGRVCKQE
jgi:hypothetical protein